MTEGKNFEQEFKDSIPDDIQCYRHKDGTSSWDAGVCKKCKTPIEKNTRFQAKNISDFHVYYGGRLIYIELKSTLQKSLSFSAVRETQKEEMLNAAKKYKGVKAGLLVNFRSVNETYWISIEQFDRFEKSLESKSIPLKKFQLHGIKAGQRLKKVHYTYDVVPLFESIIK